MPTGGDVAWLKQKGSLTDQLSPCLSSLPVAAPSPPCSWASKWVWGGKRTKRTTLGHLLWAAGFHAVDAGTSQLKRWEPTADTQGHVYNTYWEQVCGMRS